MTENLPITRNKNSCQWLGDSTTPCGESPCVANSHYCETHYPRVYQLGSALYKRKRDLRKKNAYEQIMQLFEEAVAELAAEQEI